ncbi:hypothetical protein OAU96_01050 [Planctomycetota bacterium]|nr:hypothetical protein [Planctomycetota bacterium]
MRSAGIVMDPWLDFRIDRALKPSLVTDATVQGAVRLPGSIGLLS